MPGSVTPVNLTSIRIAHTAHPRGLFREAVLTLSGLGEKHPLTRAAPGESRATRKEVLGCLASLVPRNALATREPCGDREGRLGRREHRNSKQRYRRVPERTTPI